MDLLAPHLREKTIGRGEVEAGLRQALASGQLSNGWMIAGPKGSGKATLAYRLARAMLEPGALAGEALDMSPEARAYRQIAARGHPDLFVAERLFDDKNDRYATEITVETIRELSSFLSKTAGAGGWRVAIVDSADELNRNAANALLKSLEEPPHKTALLLVCNQPGALLATIRSRCRRIDLRPLPSAEIVALVTAEAGLDQPAAEAIASVAGGRPGYALTLAAGEGADAARLAEEFLKLCLARRDAGALGPAFAGKTGGEKWEIFVEIVLQRVADAARAAARGVGGEGGLSALRPGALVEAQTRMRALATRGEALNVDRGQLLFALARELRAA